MAVGGRRGAPLNIVPQETRDYADIVCRVMHEKRFKNAPACNIFIDPGGDITVWPTSPVTPEQVKLADEIREEVLSDKKTHYFDYQEYKAFSAAFSADTLDWFEEIESNKDLIRPQKAADFLCALMADPVGFLSLQVREDLPLVVTGITIYKNFLIRRYGAVFKFDDRIVSQLLASDADLAWEHLTVPYPSCLFDFGDTGIVLDSLGAELVAAVVYDNEMEVSLQILGRRERPNRFGTFELNKNLVITKRPGQKILDGIQDESSYNLPLGGDDDAMVVKEAAKLRDFVNLVLCTCLALSTGSLQTTRQDHEGKALDKLQRVKSPKKRRAAKRALQRAVSHTMVNLPSSDRGIASGESAYSISKTFSVRGHFRNQAHGPGRSLRKVIWIEPFVKGLRHGRTEDAEREDYRVGMRP